MVLLHIKRGEESQFLYETNVTSSVDDVVKDVVAIFNGRLKVTRICFELDELGKHGTFLPADMMGLTDEQILELKLKDPWADKCAPPNHVEAKDPMGRRCGRAPPANLRDVLAKAAERAKEIISKKKVQDGKTLTQKDVSLALDEVRGATMIAFPAGLPPHDPVRQELENVEDLSGMQASLEVLDPARACLWCCGKKLMSGHRLSAHLGNNDKCKVVAKVCKSGEGAPGREPVMSEDERKQLMLHAYHRQEALKKLECDEDDQYLRSDWADGGNLKRQFHGLNNISWKPV